MTVETHWPSVSLSGGPSPAGIELAIDGKPLRKVSHVEIVTDVNDAVRVRVEQLASVANLSVVPASIGYTYRVRAFLSGPDTPYEAWDRNIEGVGDTAAEAFEDVARQLREEQP